MSQRLNSHHSQEKLLLKHNFRSEKLFKEQLKTIIKKKIVYEKKQLGVLQAFKQDIERIVGTEENRLIESTEDYELDTYFRG